MNLRIIAPIGLLALIASACSSSDPQGFGGDPDESPKLVLRIEQLGGFVPMDYAFRSQPQVVWMSDGTVYTVPPMIEIYPQPIQTGYEVAKFTPADVDALRRIAEEGGLLEDGDVKPDPNGPQVADASTAVFTYVEEDGTEHIVTAYALGIDPDSKRQRLNDVMMAAIDPASWVETMPESKLVTATTIRIGIAPYQADPDTPQEARAWPLQGSLAEFGEASEENAVTDRCGTLTGADLKAFLAAAEGANVLTPWTSDGKTYSVLVDPITPDEDGSCEPSDIDLGSGF